jgi:hypothetical protein
LFIFCGAFTGLEKIIEERLGKRVSGFEGSKLIVYLRPLALPPALKTPLASSCPPVIALAIHPKIKIC